MDNPSRDFKKSERKGMCHCMTVFGHAVLFVLKSKIRRHCVGEDFDAVALEMTVFGHAVLFGSNHFVGVNRMVSRTAKQTSVHDLERIQTARSKSVSVLVPSGTVDNSPPIYRWVSNTDKRQVPSGTTDCPIRQLPTFVNQIDKENNLSPLRGFAFQSLRNPPINRWAIIGCPMGTKRRIPGRLRSIVPLHDRLRSRSALRSEFENSKTLRRRRLRCSGTGPFLHCSNRILRSNFGL